MTQLNLPAGMERAAAAAGRDRRGHGAQVPYAAALLSQRGGLGSGRQP